MEKRNYSVVLNTPLGKRQGTMELSIVGSQIEGTLCLFQNQERVSGEVDSQGNCTLHGRFTTLMNQFYYEAVGKIQENCLELTLCGGKSIYPMSGCLIPQQEMEDDGGLLRSAEKDGYLR
ncbi:MAG: hypothetical protein LUD84_05755 [Clostridiales bacterium]|nr:hypothetical protein [Clostridiales bacterium]